MAIRAEWVANYPARMHTGTNKQAFFKVRVTYLDGTAVNDASVYLYNISTDPGAFIETLKLVSTGDGVYGRNPGTTAYGDCLNIPAAGDVIVEAIVSSGGVTARIAGVASADHMNQCP
jgi:hypothetical protein